MIIPPWPWVLFLRDNFVLPDTSEDAVYCSQIELRCHHVIIFWLTPHDPGALCAFTLLQLYVSQSAYRWECVNEKIRCIDAAASDNTANGEWCKGRFSRVVKWSSITDALSDSSVQWH